MGVNMPFELHRAVEADNLELAEFLIKKGADVNEIQEGNKAPLFLLYVTITLKW